MALILKKTFQNSLFGGLQLCSIRNKSSKNKKTSGGSKKKKPGFVVLRAQRDDYKRILKLMWHSYYDYEPTIVALGIRPNECMDQSILKTLEEGISAVAKCKFTGDILGACVNETTNPWEPDHVDKLACTMACPKMRALYHFYAHLQRLPSLWKCYHVPKIFEDTERSIMKSFSIIRHANPNSYIIFTKEGKDKMSHLFVRKADRNKGIATALVRASRDIAADCGYQVARIDCTNYYSGMIARTLKMKRVAEIPYCSYIGENLDPIFKTAPPHTKVEIYVDDELYEKR